MASAPEADATSCKKASLHGGGSKFHQGPSAEDGMSAECQSNLWLLTSRDAPSNRQ